MKNDRIMWEDNTRQDGREQEGVIVNGEDRMEGRDKLGVGHVIEPDAIGSRDQLGIQEAMTPLHVYGV